MKKQAVFSGATGILRISAQSERHPLSDLRFQRDKAMFSSYLRKKDDVQKMQQNKCLMRKRSPLKPEFAQNRRKKCLTFSGK
ncbi:MAG: hypothetical protein IKQ91_02605 [Oscillospiraceae bacterium]|nr:hypothetical protein [Oscillospiraceae bacterium]